MSERVLLVIEDGSEYEEFATAFLSEHFLILSAHSAKEALELGHRASALLVDLRFERAAEADLVGDVAVIAKKNFGGDRQRALRWVKDQQGTLILNELRRANIRARALFVHDFPDERLANLRKLYGDVCAVSRFDREQMLTLLLGPA